MPVSQSQTVTVKTKYIWLFLAIFLVLLASAPALYYVNGLAAPAGSSSPGVSVPSSPGRNGLAINCNNPCTIVIQNSIFGTGALANHAAVVKAGTTVTWSNQDGTQHTSTSDTGIWGSKILNPGNTFSFTFSTPGTYTYHCEIHPMTGTIVVVSS